MMRKSNFGIQIVPQKRRKSLNNCPVGLFYYEETLAVMTEYSTSLGQRDAYIVSSGEYFWGGTSDPKARGKLLVTPCDLVEVV